jgi:uncharacterized protein
MVKSKFTVLACVFLLLLLLAQPVHAEKDLVVDLADVFSGSEIAQLADEARRLGESYNMDIVIVTTDDARGKTARAFADDFFDEHGYGVGDDYSGILFLIDYDNREAYVSTSGMAIRYLTDQRIELVLDAVIDGGLADGNPFGAANAFLTATAGFLQAGIPSDQHTVDERFNTLTPAEGVIGFIASGAVFLFSFFTTRRQYRGKDQKAVFEFRRNSIANLGIVQDQLVKSFVTSRIRPTQPVNRTGSGSSMGGGRSTVHRSSGGRTHGGGGRKF